MKNTIMVISFVLVLCFIAGCQQGEKVLVEPMPDVEVDIQVIKDIVAEWEAAVNAGDVDIIMSLYADESVRIPTNQPAIKGKEAIRSGYQQLFDKYDFQDKYVVEDVNMNSVLTVAHITWSTSATPKAGRESINANGNWIIVFKKQPEWSPDGREISYGEWKCIYSIFSDESLVSPTQIE